MVNDEVELHHYLQVALDACATLEQQIQEQGSNIVQGKLQRLHATFTLTLKQIDDDGTVTHSDYSLVDLV